MKKTYTTQEVIDILKEQFPDLTYAQIKDLVDEFIAERDRLREEGK